MTEKTMCKQMAVEGRKEIDEMDRNEEPGDKLLRFQDRM